MNFIKQITNREELNPFDFTSKKGSPVKGRRAGSSAAPDELDDELFASPQRRALTTAPPGGKRAGGWATSTTGGGFGSPAEDSRFLQPDTLDDADDIPAIPDLDDVVEQDLTQQVAQAPNIAVNRVATFKELDSDLLRHAAFSTLDDIDLRMLTEGLANEADIREPDIEWRWDSLFTEVSSELLQEWDDGAEKSTEEAEEMPLNL